MCGHIRLSPGCSSLTVRLGRDFDLTAQRLLNTASLPANRLRCRCALVFAEVEKVRDPGIDLLLLSRRGLDADAETRIGNCRQVRGEQLQRHSTESNGIAA